MNGLVCVQLSNGSSWRRACETGADCKLPGTFCPVEFGHFLAYCFANYCGSSDPYAEDFPQNGETFESCSPSGRQKNPLTGRTGSCIPFVIEDGFVGTCDIDGTSKNICRIRGSDDPANACAPGWFCNESTPLAATAASCSVDADCPDAVFACDEGLCVLKACAQDAECGEGGYCTFEGYCGWEGECIEVCNSGTAGANAGPHAGCDEPGWTCERTPSVRTPLDAAHAFGVCEGPPL